MIADQTYKKQFPDVFEAYPHAMGKSIVNGISNSGKQELSGHVRATGIVKRSGIDSIRGLDG